MKPSERMKQIKEIREKCFTPQFFEIHANHVDYLIKRVEHLEKSIDQAEWHNPDVTKCKVCEALDSE